MPCRRELRQGVCILFRADDQLAVLLVADKRLTGEHIAAQDALRKKRLDRVLQVAAQRSCAELRVIGRVDDKALCRRGQLALELLVGKALIKRRDLQIDDASDVFLRQGLIEDDLIQPPANRDSRSG